MCTAPSAKPPAFILSSIDSNWHLGALTLPLCSGVGVRLDGLNLVRSNYSWPRFLRSFHIFCIVSIFFVIVFTLSPIFIKVCHFLFFALLTVLSWEHSWIRLFLTHTILWSEPWCFFESWSILRLKPNLRFDLDEWVHGDTCTMWNSKNLINNTIKNHRNCRFWSMREMFIKSALPLKAVSIAKKI